MRALLLATVLTACGGLQTRPPDGGTGGGTSGGANGGGSGGGQGGGTSTNLVPVTVIDGGGGFTFQDISPMKGFMTPDWDNVAGNAANYVVVTNSFGRVDAFNGTQWSALFDTGVSDRLEGLYVDPAGAIYTGGANELFRCRGGCADAGAWKAETVGGRYFASLCGKGTDVYAVGHLTANHAGIAYKYNGALDTWAELSGGVFADDYRDCAVGADDTLYLAGKRYVVEVTSTEAKKIDLVPGGNIIGLLQWRAAIATNEGVVLAGDNKRVARRGAAGSWSVVVDQPSLDSQSWTAAAPGATGEVLLGGAWPAVTGTFASLEASALTIYRQPYRFNVFDLWAAGPNLLFIVGEDENDAPMVLRATR